MARLLGPDLSRRTVTQTVGSSTYEFSGRTATVYTDEACTQLADIAVFDPANPSVPGTTIASSQLTLTSASRVPQFWYPTGVDTLYAQVGGLSHSWALPADVDSRLDRTAAGPWLRPDAVLRAQPVTNNNWVASAITNQTVAGTARSRHRVTNDCSDIRLVYGGHYTDNPSGQYGTDTDQPAAIPVKASIEVAGVIYRVTFAGQLQGNVDPGGMLVSDPFPVELTAGTDLYVRTYTTATNWFANTASFGAGTGGVGGWSATDLTAPGSAAVPDVTHWMFAPMAVLGSPVDRSVPSVGIIGDSLSVGSGDAANSAGASSSWGSGGVIAGGFVIRALYAASIPWVHIGHGGERAYRLVSFANRFRRTAYLSGCTHAICTVGVNDVFTGQTVATMQANWVTLWKMAAQRGCRVFQTTTTPSTTSTDAFATVGNQTTANAGYEANRVTLNTWLRDGAPMLAGVATTTGSTAAGVVRAGGAGHPLSGWFEIAYLVESAPNSGLWKANFTADGLHPTTTGHIAAQAGITTALLSV